MKKLLLPVLISTVVLWGCSSLVYVSNTGDLMKAREEDPLAPTTLFTPSVKGKTPDVSNDNTLVAFTREDSMIVYRTIDGSMERVVETGVLPRWSPIGNEILFWGTDTNTAQKKLCLYNKNTGLKGCYCGNLPESYGHDWWDSVTLVYGKKTGPLPQDIYLYFCDIRNNNEIGPVLPCRYPVVSRDGKLMACDTYLQFGAFTLHYIKIFNVPSLSPKATISFIYQPTVPSIWHVGAYAFSGDNERLLFSATPPNETQREIYSVKVDGTDMKRLSTIPGNDTQPNGYMGLW